MQEIKNSLSLRCAWVALLASYVLSLSETPYAVTLSHVANGFHVCPPYFQNCEWLYFFDWVPVGYSGPIFYALLFLCVCIASGALYNKYYTTVWFCTLALWMWHTALTFILSYSHTETYQYYIFVFGTVLLFCGCKRFFLQFALVWLYVLAAIPKLNDSWMGGEVFLSSYLGLPLIPDTFVPVATNIVVIMEISISWLLLSRWATLRNIVLMSFCFFHVYSSILVGFIFPTIVLSMLFSVFVVDGKQLQILKISKKTIFGWILMLLLLAGSLIPKVIEGDERLTFEGIKYGLYMFDASHQCYVTAADNSSGSVLFNSQYGYVRSQCDPYYWWYRLNNLCMLDNRDSSIGITLTIDHKVNRGDFLRIVDVHNICDVEYVPFEHNQWIKKYSDDPARIPYPQSDLPYHYLKT